jgi:hypothetical protein
MRTEVSPPTRVPTAPEPPPVDHLTLFLAERDAPCPACGYNLRRLLLPVCPECGERLELRVGMVEPRMGLWITGLMASASGAGFNLLLLGYILITLAWRRGQSGFMYRFVVINAVGLLVEGAIIALWLTQRHRFRHMGFPARIALVVVAALVSVIDLVVFTAFIR